MNNWWRVKLWFARLGWKSDWFQSTDHWSPPPPPNLLLLEFDRSILMETTIALFVSIDLRPPVLGPNSFRFVSLRCVERGIFSSFLFFSCALFPSLCLLQLWRLASYCRVRAWNIISTAATATTATRWWCSSSSSSSSSWEGRGEKTVAVAFSCPVSHGTLVDRNRTECVRAFHFLLPSFPPLH